YVGINQHGDGLVETADEVLAFYQVDAGFAADGRVDLREQGGGHLHDRDAAHENRGQETTHVVHDAAAERNDEAGAVGAAAKHFLGRAFHVRQALAFFTAGQEDDLVRDCG